MTVLPTPAEDTLERMYRAMEKQVPPEHARAFLDAATVYLKAVTGDARRQYVQLLMPLPDAE